MKIAIVLTYYRPHWTGLTQYAARLAEGLTKRGHGVEVLCSRHDRNLAKTETVAGVSVNRVNYWCRFIRSVIMPSFPFYLWQIIRRNEVVVAYLPLQEAPLVALMARQQKKKCYLVHNGDLMLPEEAGLPARIVERVYGKLTDWAIRMSTGVIIQTKDYARQSKLLAKHEDKWRVVMPLFDLPKVKTVDVMAFRKKWGLEKGVSIGFSGRFVEEKGVAYLLEAIEILIKEYPNMQIVMAGDYKIGYEKYWQKIERLVRRYKEYITLLGLVDNPYTMAVFYKSIDILVQPSQSDCFPSSQVEALLSGTPTVCSNIPGARWAVRESKMGILVEPKDPQTLAKGIIKALKEKKKLTVNWGKAKSMFDYSKTLDDYEKLLAKD